jgi:hypothetical protein
MGIRVNVPKVEGMDTSLYSGWDTRMQHQRKIMHFEMEEEDVVFVQSLVEEAKNRKLFEKYFGPMARATNILESKRGGKKEKGRSTSKIDMSALASYCKKHVNYQMSTRYDGLSGIYDVDKKHPFYSVTDPSKVVGYLTLRYMMYNHFKMEDGSAMFHEIHQGQPMSPVDVVVANCAEAEAAMLMMQKNSAAYASYYLEEGGEIDPDTIKRVIQSSLDPSLVNAIGQCNWDKVKKVLTTPEDEANEKMRSLEKAAWYNNMFGDHMLDTSKKEKNQYAAKEMLDELNAGHSFKSVHKKKGNYQGTPGAVEFDLSGKRDGREAAGSVGGGTAKSVGSAKSLEGMSREQLIALMRKHNISPKTVGSQPTKGNSEAGSGCGAEAESLSSGSSSNSLSDESSGKVFAASASSVEDVTAGRKSAHGE